MRGPNRKTAQWSWWSHRNILKGSEIKASSILLGKNKPSKPGDAHLNSSSRVAEAGHLLWVQSQSQLHSEIPICLNPFYNQVPTRNNNFLTSSKKFPRQQIVKYLFFKGLEDFNGGTAAQMDGWNAHCKAFTVSNLTPVLIVDLNAWDRVIFLAKHRQLIVDILEKKTALSTSDSFSYGVPLCSPPPASNPQKEKVSSKRIVEMGLFPLCLVYLSSWECGVIIGKCNAEMAVIEGSGRMSVSWPCGI